jgi:DNA-binding NtrC family response regulator
MSDDDNNLPGMIGRHPAMRAVYRLVRLAAATDLPVLIVGETGTGKELVARALHALSAVKDGPFVDVNCAAIPETLAEAEFFGAEKGAYTGAAQRRDGLLAEACGGTLYLDEVCSMPWGIQAKLLRAIEFREFRRVGGKGILRSTFRIVASVAASPPQLVAADRLRADLVFRLAAVQVTLPPLRNRRADIPDLTRHFLHRGPSSQNGWEITPGALALLRAYSWPGNVRELRTVVERLRLLEAGTRVVDLGRVRQVLGGHLMSPELVQAALQSAEGSVRGAARLLGVSRIRLRRFLERHRSAALPG